MKNQLTKQLVLSGLFIALGIILPMVFHVFGGGVIFLPMHIPVIIAGFFLSVPYALIVGVLTPLLSSLLTGMPPVFPVLPLMMFELATYGVIASFFYRKCNMNVYVSLIVSMVCGRIMAGVVVWVLATFFMAKLPGPIIFITGTVVKSIPGIIIQLIFIPAVVKILSKNQIVNQAQNVA